MPLIVIWSTYSKLFGQDPKPLFFVEDTTQQICNTSHEIKSTLNYQDIANDNDSWKYGT
jgi:hypothetical protein